jgi:hypothetical protein
MRDLVLTVGVGVGEVSGVGVEVGGVEVSGVGVEVGGVEVSGVGVEVGGVEVSGVGVEGVLHRDSVSSFTAVALSPPPQKFPPHV